MDYEPEYGERPNFSTFINWGFQALLLAMVSWGVSELSSLTKSVQDLNVKMAIVLTKAEGYERRIEKLEERLEALDTRRRRDNEK